MNGFNINDKHDPTHSLGQILKHDKGDRPLCRLFWLVFFLFFFSSLLIWGVKQMLYLSFFFTSFLSLRMEMV